MEHIWKHVVLFYVVLLFHLLLLPVNSEHQRNSSHTDGESTMVLTSSTVIGVSVDRRGGMGGHGSGHASSMGAHGGNGEHGMPHPVEGGGVIPIYGAGGSHHRNNNRHHGRSNGTLNYVCFYQYLVLFLSMVTTVYLYK